MRYKFPPLPSERALSYLIIFYDLDFPRRGNVWHRRNEQLVQYGYKLI